MRVKVFGLMNSIGILLVCLICVSVIVSVPVTEFDIWSDDLGKNDIVSVWGGNTTKREEVHDVNRLPRVLNFFPVPFVEECKAKGGRRRGICMNTYECRIQGGKSHGFCALGFGVCCVFTATCNEEVINNLTYFVNPDFPDVSIGMSSCSLIVKKIDPEVSQLRFDFNHFNLGQPNRKTGECEEDFFRITAENTTQEVTMCGLNSGQQVLFDVENVEEVKINMNLSRKAVTRLWEIIITQIEFAQKAPPGCLQYYEGRTGIIQTMNFADNGRHLANQDYTICIRQEKDFCSIAYEPCHENAFRIAPNTEQSRYRLRPPTEVAEKIESADTNSNLIEEGSGDGLEESFRALDMCNDKIVLPCESDELIMPGMLGITSGFCSLVHCGLTLCPSGNSPCRIESSAKPFTIGVHFGPSTREASPDDNLGMCLSYEQIPCGE